jgi:CO/xanthine dehydrogenase Mo-binding subunit
MAVEEQVPLRLVGKRIRRVDSPERLTGHVRYAGDLYLPGLLHGRLVRSPYAAARILSVDKQGALQIPGVVAVLTARDLPVRDLRAAVESRRIVMAFERATYVGQPVAIVLAETEAAAEDGAQAVQVEYEPLTPAVDPLAALLPDAPVVRARDDVSDEDLAMHGAVASGGGSDAPQAPNVARRTHYQRGDVDKALAEADVVVTREYRTPWVHQSYMEPHTCAATVDPFGNVVVYASTQAMFHIRDTVAAVLGKPSEQVRVYAMPVGGGFGGKLGLIEPLVAACTVALGRPVRLAFTRIEDFSSAGPAPSSIVRVTAGARKDGTFTALKGHVIFDAGAKAGSPAGLAALCLGVFYRWENLDLEATEVVTNKTPTGAYRAPGMPQAMFAGESAVYELIEKLGLDQIAVRKMNAARGGDIRPDGTPWPPIGLAQCLERAEPIYRAELAAAGPNEGVGVALGGWFGGTEPAAAICRLESDGTLMVAIGAVDLTGTNTSLQVIAAEAFGLDDAGGVHVRTVDTDAAPHAGSTGGSKTIYTMGPAVMRAAQEARERVLKIAAAELEASVEDLEMVGGEVRVKGVPGKVKTLQEIYRVSVTYGGKYEPVAGKGESAITERSPGTGVHMCRVHVDPETGRVEPVRYVVVQDVGRAINPATVEEQLHGGGAQGVGWAVYEEIVHDESGTPVTSSFMDYTVPKARQIPELEAVLVEVPSPIGPFGAKGVGEPPIIPGGATIANAVAAATGARVTALPLTAERVRRALADLAGQEASRVKKLLL